uniref:Uncharacterized protein n=1 Tax=Anguilla anguilla TaxID=7936 RepID=A0A0E9R7E9_ANGAN
MVLHVMTVISPHSLKSLTPFLSHLHAPGLAFCLFIGWLPCTRRTSRQFAQTHGSLQADVSPALAAAPLLVKCSYVLTYWFSRRDLCLM